MGWRAIRFAVAALALCSAGCAPQAETPQERVDAAVARALENVGLKLEEITLPRLGRPFSTAGRLAVVDAAMRRPTSMIALSQRLVGADAFTGTRAAYLAELLAGLGFRQPPADSVAREGGSAGGDAAWLPAGKVEDVRLARVIRDLLSGMEQARLDWRSGGGEPTGAELAAIGDHLASSVSYDGLEIDPRLLMPDTYHAMGARVRQSAFGAALVRLLAVVDSALPRLGEVVAPPRAVEWDTPLGRVRIAGRGDDHHSGAYALLIDLGGDDLYREVGQALEPGRISVVIDVGGNDTVRWDALPGPGSGVLGIGVWLDGGGNDRYSGSNLGLGAGLMGAGVLWDVGGDDRYEGGSLVEGTGQYGVGVLVDENGDDEYVADVYSQGFAGPGGVGIQVDLQGDDRFFCGGLIPDQAPDRAERHVRVHYLSMCQGYSFGIRPRVSGGVGVLLDREGSDHYRADLFAQGGSYWFGLGMLVDGGGDDRYDAFEHCQGESLHLGAGFLGDWAGNDSYTGYEHCQGVGMDRAAGVLYDHGGDDSYLSTRQSQGAGLKPLGVGMLIDVAGNDRYRASEESQGFALKPDSFPDALWPLGVFVDFGGKDEFVLPGSPPMNAQGRIQGRQGIAVHGSSGGS